ncbi:MAG: hypothetical protein WC004_03080 [Candidatus Absconditabacterales bacterium]
MNHNNKATQQYDLQINKVKNPFDVATTTNLYGLGSTTLRTAKSGSQYIAITGADTDGIRSSLTSSFALLGDKLTVSVFSKNNISTYYLQSDNLNAVKNDLGTLYALTGHESELGFSTIFFDNPDNIKQHPGLKGKVFTVKRVDIDKKYMEQLADTSSQEVTCSFNYLCIPHGAILEGKDPVQGREVTVDDRNEDIFAALAEDQEPDSYHNLLKNGKPFGYKRIVQDGKNGIMSPSGKIILDYQYDCMPGNVDALGHILVRNGKKWGLLHLDEKTGNCKEVVPCMYDEVTRFKFKNDLQELYAMSRIGENRYIVHKDYSITPK